MTETLVERVLAAKAAAEATYAAHVQNGGSLNETQQAEILIAQVQAIIAIPDEPALTEEPKE